MMNKKTSIIMFTAIGLGLLIGMVGCGQKSNVENQDHTLADVPPSEKEHDHEGHHQHESHNHHKAHHQGCLNAIETCAVGHTEVKLEGDTFKLWFVGGENETGKAVRVSDQSISLLITTPHQETKTLVLSPQPNELAEEKVGDCSYFEGKAPWLLNLEHFSAVGKVNFKGKTREMLIEYPEGHHHH